MKHEPQLAQDIKDELSNIFPELPISTNTFPVTDGPRLATAVECKEPNVRIIAGSLREGVAKHGLAWMEGSPVLAVYSKPAEFGRVVYTAELFGE